jgi:lipocalin
VTGLVSVRVPVWLDLATGEAEYVTLQGEPDREYGLVFGPDQVERWLVARDEAVRRHEVPGQRRRRRRA